MADEKNEEIDDVLFRDGDNVYLIKAEDLQQYRLKDRVVDELSEMVGEDEVAGFASRDNESRPYRPIDFGFRGPMVQMPVAFTYENRAPDPW